MEAFLKKKVVEPLLEKIKDWIGEVLESNEDKERPLLSAVTKGGVPPEEIALNLGVSVPTVRLVLKAERFLRSLEKACDVVSKDIIRKLLEIIQEIQNVKKANLTETDSKPEATGISERHSEPEYDSDQIDIIRQLGLPVADLAQLFDLTEADAVALISEYTLSDEIPVLDVEPSEFSEAQLTEENEPLELHMVASARPQSQHLEERGLSESSSDSTELSEAISRFRHILNPRREKVIIIDRNTILNEVLELYDKHPSIAMYEIYVSYEGERGMDYGGLTKDL